MGPPESVGGGEAPGTNGGARKNESDFGNAGAAATTGREIVDTLGEALAGVNLGSKGNNFGAAAVSSANFALAPGGSPGDGSGGAGWDNYSDQHAQKGFPGTTTGIAPAPAPRDVHQAGGSGVDSHYRNESLDLFLSQSPSQSLGDDVFKLSHPNLPGLVPEKERGPSGETSTAFRLPGQSLAPVPSRTIPEGRRRTESPSCSVTAGTTASSRSGSPYANNSEVANSGRTIQAYQRYDSAPPTTENAMGRNQSSFGDDDRSSSSYSLNHGHGSHPSLTNLDSGHRSPYAKDRNQIKSVGSGSPYDQGFDRQGNFPNPAESPSSQQVATMNPQSQVLYMAVPSPDGRGQVLQPVQMVQLPGKPYTYVVPGPAAGLPNASVPQGALADGSQAMMVLPPLANQPAPDYSTSAVVSNDTRSPVDNRSRVAHYAVDGNRGYSGDTNLGGGQYQPDAAVASLYSAPQRPPLDALLGQVRRLSRDQVGCRLVQQALDEEGPMAATLILNEGLPFWGEAMVDPFGNYLFQKILEKVTPEERIMLVRSVSTRLVNASLNLHGTRSVQKVVELCALDEQNGSNAGVEETAADILTKSLAPAAARLCIDSHGNHVIQRILLKLGHKHSKFVFDAVAASVGDVARHRHGCCVIQRCLDSPPSDARSHLVHRIVEKALELMQDAYGNYVVQYVLDVCADEDVHAVCESVVGKVNLLAIQKFSSNVMEKCLERCSDRVKELYMQEMSDPERIRELMMDPFGNYVVQRALSVATHAQAIRLVEAMRPHLIATQSGGPNGQRNGGVRNTAGGRRIIAKICRRFPNFTLSAVGSQDELYSQNRGNQRHSAAPAVLATYASMGGHHHHGQHFAGPVGAGDPRLATAPGTPHIPVPVQQQQSYYSIDGPSAYYDHFNNGQGGYPGM